MKPTLEDVLFLNQKCKHKHERDNKVFKNKSNARKKDDSCPVVEISQEVLKNLVTDELKDKYYPGFIKYFKSSSKECILNSAKNPQKSVEARIKANSLFAKKEHDSDIHGEIWRLYYTSVALAPAKSKELLLAYECRSNLLLHFKKYEDCIKDIDRALSMTEMDLLKVKLLCRKMSCFVALNKDVVEKEKLWEILKYHFEKIDGAFKDDKFLKMIKQAKNGVSAKVVNKIIDEGNRFTAFTSFDDLAAMLNEEKKYIIADREYEAGEPIIVTKPTIASVNPDKFYAYCSHCLAFTWAGIPCNECSLCMYCSEECKEKAWEKYHVLECKISPHIDFSHSAYYNFKNSLKLFIMGVREFGSIPKLLEKVRKVGLLHGNSEFVTNDKISDSDFLKFFTLPVKIFTDSCSLSYLIKHSCFLMAYLTQTLEAIFEKEVGSMRGKELAKDEDFIYSILVMCKIMILCELYNNYPEPNRSTVGCLKYENPKLCALKRCCSVGKFFNFFKGFIQNSCNPNVSICAARGGKLIYYCTQPIKKMELMTVAEIDPFYLCDKKERNSSNPCKPHDPCRCIACEKDWPPFMLEGERFQYKFMRRLSMVQTKGSETVEKYLVRFFLYDDLDDYFRFNADEFQELAKDTNSVVSLCGQPSFATSFMIMTLCEAFQMLYGETQIPSGIPKYC